MAKKIFFTLFVLFALPLLFAKHAFAEEPPPVCMQLDEKVSGNMVKYSLHGEANGAIFFSGIRCAIKHRNKELCAMEMVSFDTTSKVYDYYTVEELDIGKAYFWLDEKNTAAPVLAFSTKESAEKYGSENTGGVILDFTGLADRKFD